MKNYNNIIIISLKIKKNMIKIRNSKLKKLKIWKKNTKIYLFICNKFKTKWDFKVIKIKTYKMN